MNLRTIVQKSLAKLGYEIHRTRFGREYTRCLAYSPWVEDWFQEIYGKIKGYTVVSEDRCYIIHRLCSHCLYLEGDFVECGVYKGGTAFLIAHVLKNNSTQDKQLHLFDTFAGMPGTADKDPSDHKQADFGDTSLNAIKEYLQIFPDCSFYPGFIPETFEPLKDKQFAFCHIDVDLYQTTVDCLSLFSTPRRILLNRMNTGFSHLTRPTLD